MILFKYNSNINHMTKRVYQSIILCFLISWGIVLISKINGLEYQGNNGLILAIVYMFMPALSVILLSKFVWKEKVPGLSKPKGLKVFALAWLFPVVLSFLVIPISMLFPGVDLSLTMQGMMDKLSPEQATAMKTQIDMIGPFLPFVLIIQALIAGITINAIAALGEEYLWRGLMLKELKKYGWIKASLFIGAAWGLWHAPLILQGHNYPEHPQLGVLMMIIWCILLTPSLIYFTIRTKSVLTAAVMHGTINASYGFAILYLVGGNDLTVGLTGLSGFIVLIIINFALFLIDRRSKVRIDEMMKQY